MVTGLLRRLALRRLAAATAALMLAGAVLASDASARRSYCSPSGDYCLFTRVNASNNGVAEIRTFFPGKYKLCITDPDKNKTCDRFKLRRKGPIYKSVVSYKAEFRGTHAVRWYYGGSQLGKKLTFFIE
jgi:hypothetical protein